MADKTSMIIVQVDLDCHKCYKKICKILCQLQDCERIRTISFDDKNKTITIVGPFDPQRLACKLRCKGNKVIRDIHIVETPPVKNGKQKGKEKTPPPAADEPPSPQPAPAPKKHHKAKPTELEPPPMSSPVGPCGCHCCVPCYYQGYYDGCRCYSCGRAYAPAPCGGYRGCRTFSDEDPTAACTVM